MASEPIIPLDPSWPAMSLDQVRALLTAPGAKFETDEVAIRGTPTRVWKNAPPSLPWLFTAARAHGDRVMTIYEDERVSYDAAFRAAAALSHHLAGLGVGKGDRVALAMRNLPEWPVIFFAITALGAIAVPLNAWWTGQELAYGLKDSGAKLLIADAERLDRIAPHLGELDALEAMLISRSLGELAHGAKALEDVIGAPPAYAELAPAELPPVEIAPDDAATIFYTSGTTGNPKGALGSHRNMTTKILTTA